MAKQSDLEASHAPRSTSKKMRLGKRQAARASLLKWASSVVGLPIHHINQVQNGAVFCYIAAAFGDLDITNVQFLAVDECDVTANYRLLQASGALIGLQGFNQKAKMRHWLRLADSEADAWQFLGMLRMQFTKLQTQMPSIAVESDATPPPAPVPRKKGLKRGSSAFSTTLSNGSNSSQWLLKGNESSLNTTTDTFLLTFSPADDLSPRGEKPLTDFASLPPPDVPQPQLLSETYSDTPSTRRAHSCLLQLLSQEEKQEQ